MSIIKIDNGKTIINPENILDIASNKLITGKSVVVNNGSIEKLIPERKVRNKYGARAKIIDLPGLTLLPGLIDCHVHFALDGRSFKDSISRWQEPVRMEKKLKEELRRYLRYGIIAVRDGGDKAQVGRKAQKLSFLKNIKSPIVHSSGFAIRKTGYYGSFLGEGIKNSDDIERIINQLVIKGVKQIKILASGIVSFKEYKKVGSLQFSLSEMERVVKEAKRIGLKVMVHASSDEAVKISSLAGVDSIEHGYFLEDSTLQIMADRKIFWIPTVVPVYNQTVLPCKTNFTEEQINVISKTYNLQLKKIKKAKELGVNLAVGTDAGAAGVLHGKSFYRELELYQKAGLSNIEIVKAATAQGSRLLGLDDKIGCITEGKLPYFIAVSGNPAQDLSLLRKPEEVIIPENYNSN